MINVNLNGTAIVLRAFGWMFVIALGRDVLPKTGDELLREARQR